MIRKLPIKRETKLSDKRNLYDNDKAKAGIKIELANHDSMILEITEDWDNEDLYAAVQQRSNELSWELQGGIHLRPIECNNTKIFKAGYGGMPIIQVRRLPVFFQYYFYQLSKIFISTIYNPLSVNKHP